MMITGLDAVQVPALGLGRDDVITGGPSSYLEGAFLPSQLQGKVSGQDREEKAGADLDDHITWPRRTGR